VTIDFCKVGTTVIMAGWRLGWLSNEPRLYPFLRGRMEQGLSGAMLGTGSSLEHQDSFHQKEKVSSPSS
jgi:hypothetical protein